MKIVLIGAASHCFGFGTVVDILRAPALRGRGLEVALVDTDPDPLGRVHAAARRLRDHLHADIELTATTERRQALPGAQFAVVSVARRRWELWEQDFRVPLAHGFRHVLGENGGPGAVFHALRSFELILPICRDIEALCPAALMLNFTNPEARVLHAICHLTRVRAAGLCHGIAGAIRLLSQYLERPPEGLEVTSAGMNHFYCVLRATDRATGEDLLPTALAAAAADTHPDRSPLFRHFARIFGVFTFPSEDHIGEYLAFGSEFSGTHWHYGIERRRLRQAEAPVPDLLGEYAAGRLPVDDPRVVRASGEVAVPLIADVVTDGDGRHDAMNVLNTAGYVENLPRDGVVEVPGTADAAGLHPLSVGAIPEAFAAFMRPQYTIHSLLTEAYRTRSRRLLLQALLLDPVVNSITHAEAMLDEMLALQAEFLPTFE